MSPQVEPDLAHLAVDTHVHKTHMFHQEELVGSHPPYNVMLEEWTYCLGNTMHTSQDGFLYAELNGIRQLLILRPLSLVHSFDPTRAILWIV
jgi:hypothetical protein